MNISKMIQDMLKYKESLGYSRNSYESFLKDFERYFLEAGHTVFTEETVLPWCRKRDSEGIESFRKRLIPLRELPKYLYATGNTDFILPTNLAPSKGRKVPYIFTDEELIRFFERCDQEPFNKASPYKHLIVPVIYRLIYFCGLRPNEGRELKLSDFDYENKTIFVRKNKAHKERLIPVSDDVAELCQRYIREIKIVNPDSEWMFPSKAGGPCRKRWLADTFKRLWIESNGAANAVNVRVYLLRHRFATTVFMKWLSEGVDLNTRIPYLSAYMGHACFEDTAYYIHLLPEKLIKSKRINWGRFNELIPEAEDEG